MIKEPNVENKFYVPDHDNTYIIMAHRILTTAEKFSVVMEYATDPAVAKSPPRGKTITLIKYQFAG